MNIYFIKTLIDDRFQTITIDFFGRHEKVETLKERIFDKTGIPIECQRLIWNGHDLKDDETLEGKIPSKSTLHLVKREPSMYLYVDDHRGNRVSTIEFYGRRETVKTLKERIFDKTGIPIESQRLTRYGYEFEDHEILEDSLSNYSTLQLEIKNHLCIFM